jgi:hypothetical protein
MVADTTSIFLEQTMTRFLVKVTRAVTEVDRGRGADVEDSWQTTKRDSPVLSSNQVQSCNLYSIIFPCYLGRWKKLVAEKF